MPEPLKNLYNEELISNLSRSLEAVYAQFDAEGFQKDIFEHSWDQKELKERMNHVAVTLHQYLPENFLQSIEILKSVSAQFSGKETAPSSLR